MSAKLLRVKQLQNQLAESQSVVNELLTENKLLKTLQRRQDNALKKYEGSQEQLPQLIKSHNEEIRIINTRFKQLKLNYKVLESKLKDRDSELSNLKEQHKHLLKLSRDKQLYDREKLTKKLEELEKHVQSQQEKIQILTRKLELEGKSYRHKLNIEICKHKETQAELREARKTIDNLKSSIEGKQKYVNTAPSKKTVRAFAQPTQQSRISLPAPPPNVSIRQTQRLVQSETAINRDEDSETDSYSFGLQNMLQHNTDEDSCSDRSDSDGVEDRKDDVDMVHERSSITQAGSTSIVSKILNARGNANVSSGNSHSRLARASPKLDGLKNLVQPKNIASSSIKSGLVGNKISTVNSNTNSKYHNGNFSVNKNSVGAKTLQNSTKIKNFTRRSSVNSIEPLLKNTKNISLERRPSIPTKTFEKSHSLDSVKSNSFEKSMPNEVSSTNKATNSPLLDDDYLKNKYDHELSKMRTELENELDHIMFKKSEEDIAATISKDHLANSVEEEIEKLERKFKIFDMPQIRKEAEDDINRIVDRACMSLLEEEIKQETSDRNPDKLPEHSSNEVRHELIEKDDFLQKLEDCYQEVDSPQPDIVLGETQKANLLKALNSIDQESSSNNISGFFHDKNENYKPNSYKNIQGFEHVNSNGIKSKRKCEVMKEFSEESATVSTK
uniref:Lebercilin domain-containing protein n=2 Tax=Rhodnius prolixus TaxID=13249 RepID=T1I312_RHOPR